MIKFKNIDENGNKKIYFSRNDGPYCTLLPKKSLHSQELDEYHAPSQNRSGYQKVFPNSIKPAGYTGSRRKSAASNGRTSSLTLILQQCLQKTER